MLPKYVFALGGTTAVKKFMDWLKQLEEQRDFLVRKANNKEHQVGGGE